MHGEHQDEQWLIFRIPLSCAVGLVWQCRYMFTVLALGVGHALESGWEIVRDWVFPVPLDPPYSEEIWHLRKRKNDPLVNDQKDENNSSFYAQ
jgi:hypothetical protein